jgi:hypothetical protein
MEMVIVTKMSENKYLVDLDEEVGGRLTHLSKQPRENYPEGISEETQLMWAICEAIRKRWRAYQHPGRKQHRVRNSMLTILEGCKDGGMDPHNLRKWICKNLYISGLQFYNSLNASIACGMIVKNDRGNLELGELPTPKYVPGELENLHVKANLHIELKKANRKKILDVMEREGWSSPIFLADECGLPTRTVRRHIKEILMEGKAEIRGNTTSREYRLVNKLDPEIEALQAEIDGV